MVERNGLEATGIPSTGTALKNWTRDFDHQARVFDLHVHVWACMHTACTCIIINTVKISLITVVVINVLQCTNVDTDRIQSYLRCTVAGDTIQVFFFNFMSVSKLYQSINCHHLLSIRIDSQFH